LTRHQTEGRTPGKTGGALLESCFNTGGEAIAKCRIDDRSEALTTFNKWPR
jgi:hypothetical protein